MSTSGSPVWRTIVAGTLGLSAGSARAHDLWIQPSVPVAQSSGEATIAVVTLGLRVGHGDLALPVAFRPEDVVRFDATTDRATTVAICGNDGQDPAGTFAMDPARGDRWIVAYQSRPHPIALPGPRFEAYLREEGLDEIVRQRAEAGRSAHPGLERFARCAKTLLSIPDTTASTAAPALVGESGGAVDRQPIDRALGLPLELVVLPALASAPSDANRDGPLAGRPLTVQLLLRGDPLEGALVRMERTSGAEDIARSRTDRDGCVTLTPNSAGLWMIGSVHMEPSPPGTGARWDSLWASVTLTVLPASEDLVLIDESSGGPAVDGQATMGTSAVDWLRGGSGR